MVQVTRGKNAKPYDKNNWKQNRAEGHGSGGTPAYQV
jgi:hypothetical protein